VDVAGDAAGDDEAMAGDARSLSFRAATVTPEDRTNGRMTAKDHDDTVRRSFRRQTGLFTGDDSPFARRAPSPNGWLEPLDPSMVVLDVACGAAHVAEQVAPAVRQVVGIDLTSELLALGAARLREAGVADVLLQQGAATALPFVDGSFDVVCCRSALHHFGDPVAAVGEMARVCRSGGRVVVSDLVVPDAALRETFDAVHRSLDPSHGRAFTADEIVELVAAHAGPLCRREQLGPVALPLDGIMTEVADRAAVLRALDAELGGGPPTGFLPARVDGTLLVSFTSLVVHARRP
jgi:SAM-dependent methyltransferase